jgi:hypothetical protein
LQYKNLSTPLYSDGKLNMMPSREMDIMVEVINYAVKRMQPLFKNQKPKVLSFHIRPSAAG